MTQEERTLLLATARALRDLLDRWAYEKAHADLLKALEPFEPQPTLADLEDGVPGS